MLDKILYEEEVRGLTCSAGLYGLLPPASAAKNKCTQLAVSFLPSTLCYSLSACSQQQLMRRSHVQAALA